MKFHRSSKPSRKNSRRPKKSTRRSGPRATINSFWPKLRPTIETLETRTLLSGVSISGVPDWNQEGPRFTLNSPQSSPPTVVPDNASSGAINSIAVNPNNNSQVIIGTVNGGVWRSTNVNPGDPTSVTWTPLNDQQPSLSIGAVAYDAADTTGNTFYAGTGNFSHSLFLGAGGPAVGIYRTTDGGNSWTILDGSPTTGQRLDGHRIDALLVSGQTILAGAVDGDGITGPYDYAKTGGGLFRSTDGGATFFQIGTSDLPSGAVTSLLQDPNNPQTIYAGVAGQGVFRSNSLGAAGSWTPLNTGLSALSANTSTVMLAAQNIGGVTSVYVGLEADSTGVVGIYSFNPGTSNWTALAAVPAVFNSNVSELDMIADPTNAGVVYIDSYGGKAIYAYNPAGAGSWVKASGSGSLSGTAPHADSRDLQFLGNNTLLEADDGGIFQLSNPAAPGTGDLASLNGNLETTEFYSVAYDSQNHVIFGGAQDNGSQRQSSQNSLSWIGTTGGDGQYQAVDNTSLGGGNVFGYSLSDDWGFFKRDQYNNSNAFATASEGTIAGASDANPIIITSPGHGLKTGDKVAIGGVTGNTAANGNNFTVTYLNANQFSINAVGNGTYQGGGFWRHFANPSNVSGAVGSPVVITSANHGLQSGDQVTLGGLTGNTQLNNGTYIITYINSNQFSLNGTSADGSSTSNGYYYVGNSVLLKSSAGAANLSGLNAADQSFVSKGNFDAQPFVLNSVDPRMMLLGYNGVYEDADPSIANGFAGDVISDITSNVGTLSGTVSALAYGGMRAGSGYTNVAFVATTNGQLFYRGESGSSFTEVDGGGAGQLGGSGRIWSVALDPTDWRKVYVVKGNQVFFTSDVTNLATNPFVTIGGGANDNLGVTTSELRTVAAIGVNGVTIPVVGGLGGVYRLLTPGDWTKYGDILPDVVVTDVIYSQKDDVMVAATMGRGTFEQTAVSTTLATPAVLTITGDQDYAGENDTFRIVRDPASPQMIDVYINGVLDEASPFELSAFQQIVVNGLGGNDTLIIDDSNGLINPPGGIQYDGGTGGNILQIVQNGGVTQTSDVYTVGPNPGQGTDVITGTAANDVQSITFQNLAPVQDNVLATTATVNGTNGDNAINYAAGPGGGIFTGNTGFVTVDNQESYEFNNKTNLVINGLAGSDTINLNDPTTPAGLTGNITVNAGDPTAGDTLIVNGRVNATDAFTYTPATTTSDTGSVSDTGLPTVNFSGLEHLTINGQNGGPTSGGDDTLAIVTSNLSSGQTEILTPGTTFDSGHVDFRDRPGGVNPTAVPLDFKALGVAGSLSFNDIGRFDNLIYNGTSLNDTFNVSATGVVTLNDQIPVSTPSSITLTLAGLGGNDTFDVPGKQNLPGGIVVEGSDPASNVLNFTGNGTGAVTVDLAAQTVTEAGFAPVSFSGVATVNINAGAAALTVKDSAGNDNLTYTPTGASAGTVSQSGGGAVIKFTNVSSTFTLDPGTGTNSVTINGTAGDDTVQVLADNVPGDTQVGVNSLQPVQIVTAHTQNLVVNGGTGNDVLEVFSTFTPVTIPITDVGGPGTDALFLTSGGPNGLAATADVYTPGAQLGSGTDTLTFPTGTEVVHFANLAPVFDLVPSPLFTVNGTNASNAINYSEGFSNLANFLAGTPSATWGQVSVEGYEPMEFINKVALTINTGNGTDTVSTNNVNTPTGLTGITVNGGDPAAGDTIVASGATAITYAPSGPHAASITGAGPVPITTTGFDQAVLDGQASNAGLTVTAPANSTISYGPGATVDSGMAQVGSDLPLSFTNLGTAAPVKLDGTATSSLAYNGTPGNDAFSVSAAGVIKLNSQLPLTTANIANLSLKGLGGNDQFSLNGPLPYTNTIVDDGSVVNLSGATGPVGVALADGTVPTNTTITGYGGIVTLIGVDTANLNAAGNSVTVNGTSGDDDLTYSPTGTASGALALTGLNTAFNFSNVSTAAGGFALDPLGGNNTVTVNGTAGNDTIATALGAPTTVSVTSTAGPLLPIDLTTADTQALVLSGGAGNDAFSFSGIGGPNSITVVGSAAFSNTISPAPAGGGIYAVYPGTDSASGFVQTLATPAIPLTPAIAFSGVKFVNIVSAGGANADTVAVDGTSGSDVFSVTPGGVGGTTGTAQVNGGPLVSFTNLGRAASLLLGTTNAPGGSDSFSIAQPATGAIPTVSVVGGTNSSATITDANTGDGFTYTPGTTSSGTIADSAGTTYSLSGMANLSVVGAFTVGMPLSSTLNVASDSAVVTPGTATGAGVITPVVATALLPLNYGNIANPVTLAGGAGTTLTVDATDDNDTVSVDTAGNVTITNTSTGATNEYAAAGFNKLVVDAAGKNDAVTIAASGKFAGGITVNGNGSTVLNFTGDGAHAVSLDLSALTVQEATFGAVTFAGVSTLNVSAANAAVTVVDSKPNTNLTATPTGATTATVVANGGAPLVNFTGLPATGLTLNLTGGSSTLAIDGATTGETFKVTNTNVSVGGLPVNYTAAQLAALDINGTGGGNSLIVNSAVAAVVTPIVYSGGIGAGNSLQLTGGTAASDTYTPGPNGGQGNETLNFGTLANPVIESVQFSLLTPVIDNVAGPLVVKGTTGNDAITAGATANLVTVNNLESITFANKTGLTLEGNGGNDTVNINPANITLTNAGSITVNGAAGADDTLSVKGNATLGFNPTGPEAGSVTTAGNPTVSFTNLTSAAIVGDGASDNLTYTTPGSESHNAYQPGATPDSGTITSSIGGAGGPLVPLTFTNLGASGSVKFADPSGTRVNDLDLIGTGQPETYHAAANGDLQITTSDDSLFKTVLIHTPGVKFLYLDGNGGSDVFDVAGNQPFTFFSVQESGGGTPATLNFTGDGKQPITADLGAQTIQETTFNAVTYIGIGTANVDTAGAALTVTGTTGADTLAVTPSGAKAASFQAYSGGTSQNGQGGTLASLTPIGPAFNATNVSTAVGGFTINGNGGSDTLFVEGTQNADTTDVNDAASGANAVLVAGLLAVNYNAALPHVEVDGQAGADTINIAPSTTTSFLVDGGDPVGVQPGDTINLLHPPGPYQIFPGPTTDSGGLNTPGFQTVSWAHIETVINTGGGAPIVTGTNGNDEITVIARDSSYNPAHPAVPNPLLDGVQDFTVSVNGGPDMLFINTPNLFIDALSGNDDIVVREPAPNQAAWNVQVFVAGGAPSSGANRLGDNIELETPGTQSVIYEPNNPLSAVPAVPGTTFTSPGSGGGQFNDTTDTSAITATQFDVTGFYKSSAGGAENFVYAGEAGNDTLKYNTPTGAGSNLAYTPGNTPDSGTITGSQGGTALTPLTFSSLGAVGSVSFTTSNAGRTDSLVYNGTAANDTFTVDAGTGTVHLNSQVPALTPSIGNLTLNDVAGENSYKISATAGNSQPYTTINVNGSGLTDPDVLNLTGDGTAATASIGGTTSSVTGGGLGTVSVTGVGAVNLNDGAGAVTVTGNTNPDAFNVTPTGAGTATVLANGVVPQLNLTAGTLTVSDTNPHSVVVNGTNGNDTIGVARGATTVVSVNNGSALLAVNVNTANETALTVASGTGTDTIDVTGSGGLAAITVQGGQTPAADTLNVTNTATAGNTTYTPGATKDSGTIANTDGTIDFGGMRLISDKAGAAADTLTVFGTNGNDTITAAAIAAGNLAWVNGQAPIAFSGFGTLALNGRFGNDSFVVSPVGLTGLTAIKVVGNAGANNSLTINGSAGTDKIAYSPSTPGAGTVAITGSATVSMTNMSSLAVNGQGGDDTLTVTTPSADTTTVTPGATVDSGTVQSASLTPLDFSNLGSGGGLTINDSGAGSTLVYNGTAANDNFTVDDTAGTIKLNNQITVSVPAATPPATLTLNGLAGHNTLTINGAAAAAVFATLNANGSGLSDPDVLNVNGGGAALAANFGGANPTVTGGGLGTVNIAGIGTVNVNATGGALTVNDTLANENLAVTPAGAAAGTFVVDGVAPTFNFTGANASGLVANLTGGGSTLAIDGATTGATFTATNTSVTVTGDIPVNYTAAQLAQLAINGLGGLNATSAAGNTLIVNSTAAAVVTPIVFSGGVGTGNSLQLTGGTATSDSYQPGPNGGQGTDTLLFGGTVAVPASPRESVQFSLLTPVTDNVAGPLTVSGTNGNDAITAANNVVSVNNLETITFANKSNLTLNGLAGSDAFNVTPTSITLTGAAPAINVLGSPAPLANNTVTVNGSSATGNAIVYTPTGPGGANISVGTAPQVVVTNASSAVINGETGNNPLTVVGTAGNDTFVHTPGAANDAGSVAVDSLLPMSYSNLGTGATSALSVKDTGGGTNNLVVQGTANNDAFGVAGGTGTITLNSRVPITETGIQNLQLNGLSASDTFTLNATMPYANVAVNGANIANNDAVVFNGATGAIAVNLANQAASPPTLTTVTGYGGTVSLSDIALASVNGTGAATLAVHGTTNDDVINYTPTSAAGGDFSLTGLNTAFSFNIGTGAANAFTINGGGSTGGDQVDVLGPNSGSTFIADETARTVAVSNAAGTNLKPVVLGTGGTNEIQVVNLDAGIGNNTFLVAPARAVLLAGKSDQVGAANFQVPNDLIVNVVGGGANAKNALVVGTNTGGMLAANLFAAVMRDTTNSGVIRMFQDSGSAEPIQYADITYTGVATVQTNSFDPAGDATGAKQQTLVMGPDAYEPNQTLATAAYLGSGATINAANLTIFPNSQEHQFVNADVDWYRVVAQYTGTLDFQVYFNKLLFSTGHDAVPGAGELNIDVYDSNDNLITSFGANDTTSDQRRRLPVVAGETYYLKVSGADPSGLGINGFNMSIVNTPAPAPNAIGLNNVVAQGTVNNAVAPTTTTFAANNAPTPAPAIPPNFQTQPLPPLSSLDKFYDGLYLEFTSGALIGQRQLISDYSAATHTFTFASAFSAAPSPNDTFQIESDDTGRSQLDNVTRDNLPTIYIRLDQANNPNDGLMDLQGGGNAAQTPPNNTPILIPFWAGNAPTAPNSPANNGSYRIAVFDETDPNSPIFLGYANAVTGQTGVFQLQVTTPMSDGTHILVGKVEIDSPSAPSNHDVGAAVQLQIVIDTIAPPIYFGDPTVPNTGLVGTSDSGVPGQPATIADRITNVSTPTFYGVAEADAIVRLYAVTNGNSTTAVQNGDIFLGQVVATPADGTNQNPNGQWTLTSSINLNDPRYGFPLDGLRTILVTAEDAAGNVSAAQSLSIFVDTQGPTVNKINITGSPSYPLFATKLTTPSTPSPTPLVNSLDINFNDLPNRVGPSFVYPAVNPTLAQTTSNYALIGEHTGVIPITSVTLVDNTAAGGPGNTTVTLHFPPQFAPLPDDRYTLTVSDAITDNAGNALQGSYNGAGFPSGLVSGNGSQGTSFVGAFTVNSRAHIGNYSSGSVDLDINGNGVFDPQNSDAVNRDAVYAMGYPTDRLIAGNFTTDYGNPSAPGTANGFDKLAAYGQDSSGNWRWMYDLSGLDLGQPKVIGEPFAIDGLPVAGNFDGKPGDGDQVGLFDGTNWYLDVLNQGYISVSDVATPATATHPAGKLTSDMAGLPFVGNFDGFLDLATYQNGVMEFDLASLDPGHVLTGNWNVKLNVDALLPGSIPFNTVTARPVAGLLSGLGVQASFGLYLPGGTASNAGTAQWYFLNPNTAATVVTSALTTSASVAGGIGALTGNPFLNLIHQFQDQPLGGQDTFYQFGDQFSLPVVGVWDPPSNAASVLPSGQTTPATTANWIMDLYSQILGRQPNASDLTGWVNSVNTGTTPAQVAESFVISNEYRADQINKLYEQYLGRPADTSGIQWWTAVWNENGGPEQVQAGIIGSAEFYATAGKEYPNLSADAAWVTALYQDLLGRSVDPAGLSYWLTYIQTNSRASVVLGFVTSDEYRMNLIDGWFQTYLGRSLDQSSSQAFIQAMDAGLTQDEVLTEILSSQEYINKS